MHLLPGTLLLLTAYSAYAWTPPSYNGYNLVWSDSFTNDGSQQLPDQNTWIIRNEDLGVNGELETYCSSTNNVRLSGYGTLQIIPLRNSTVSNGWTSGRIESKYIFTPAAGKITFAEAYIRFGNNSTDTKKGFWPAFWTLGDSINHGTQWPACGELDIMETVNGQLIGHGTAHCDVSPGGICQETTGLTGSVNIPNQSWQLWRIFWSRSSDTSNWRSESMTWYMNDQKFNKVTGDMIGNESVWATLSHQSLFFILNMAVGGSWPGNPNSSTQDGAGAMMEVGYVAQYISE